MQKEPTEVKKNDADKWIQQYSHTGTHVPTGKRQDHERSITNKRWKKMMCARLDQEVYPGNVAKILRAHNLIYPEEEEEFAQYIGGFAGG